MMNLRHAPGDLWPFLDPQTLCNKQGHCVAYIHAQFHSYIHRSGGEKCAFSAKVPIFAQIMALDDLWPLWRVNNQYMYIFGKPLYHILPLCQVHGWKLKMFKILKQLSESRGHPGPGGVQGQRPAGGPKTKKQILAFFGSNSEPLLAPENKPEQFFLFTTFHLF